MKPGKALVKDSPDGVGDKLPKPDFQEGSPYNCPQQTCEGCHCGEKIL